MNKRLMGLIAAITLIIVEGIGPAYAQTETPISDNNTGARVNISAFVIQSDTDARIRRLEWTDFTHLGVGAALKAGDLIDPKGKAVHILCADLSEQVVTVLGPVACPKGRIIVIQNQLALAGWQRGGLADVTVPYVISPRHTLIADINPLIVWNSVLAADSYRITVRGEGLTWSTVVKGGATTMLAYPKSAPKLQPAVPYTIEVEAIANGATISDSNTEETPDRSFTVIASNQVASFKPFIDKIQVVVSDKHIASLITAQIYADNQVYADALSQMLSIVTDSKASADWQSSPIPALVLGDIYLSMGVQPDAQTAYNTALQLAQHTNDLASQALALTGLARLNTDPVKRARYASQTLDAWHTLGDVVQAAQITKEFNVN